MPRRPNTLVIGRQVLAFVLAGLLALAVVALSGWGGDEAPATGDGGARPVPSTPPDVVP